MKKLHFTFLAFFVLVLGYVQAQTIGSFTPSSVSVGGLVTITGTGLSSPTAFTMGGIPAIVISNDGTTLVGMAMPGTTTGTIAITTAGGNATSSSSLTIVPSSPPATQQGSKLVGTGAVGAAEQGFSVSLSADGNTAIVGGYNNNNSQGAAWIYIRSGGTWTQQGNKLVGTGAVGSASQGFSVSVSADGNTAMVGGYTDNSSQGAAWVYTRSGGIWTQQGSKLVGTGAVGTAAQGVSVSLSADGNTAMVGGPYDNSFKGAAWVYTRSGGTWTQQNKLVGTGGVGNSQQGHSVSLSADGNTAILGGFQDNSNHGAAWVYTRSGGTWTQQGNKLVGTGNVGATVYQGYSVSLSADGNTAIVGGRADDTNHGAAWVYTRSGGTWAQQGNKLVGTGNVGISLQGHSVSLSADGNTAMVGGWLDNGSQGAAWVYTRSGGTWTQQGNKLVGTGNIGAAYQGTSVSLSADGNTAMVGGQQDNSYQGAAWVFISPPPPPPTITSFSPASGSIGTLVSITGTNLSTLSALSIGGVSAIPISNDGTTLVAMVMPGTATGTIAITTAAGTATSSSSFTIVASTPPTAQQGNKLVGTGNTSAALQGYSVSVSADGNTAIVGGYGDNNQQGAAWIYTRSGGTWIQQGNKLMGTGAVGAAYQGFSVSLSADGNTAIIGGYADNGFQGAAWVFTRSGGTWTQQGSKLVGTGNIGSAQQGWSVSLSADGNTAMVGGNTDNSYQGAAWIYTRSGGTWTQQGNKLVGTGNIGTAEQGISVSLSADGNTAMVGGYTDNSNQGAAWVFTRSGSTWTQQGSKLLGTGNIGAANQGRSVSLSADGNTAMVGGVLDNSNQGAAWVFTRSGSTWTQQGNKLVGTGAVGAANQGYSVSLSADGNTAMVGGYTDNSLQGAAWVFTRTGGTWTQQGNKLVGIGNTGAAVQGVSVSLSADGNTAMVGGNYDNSYQGAAWVFISPPPPPPTITSFSPASGSIGTLVSITGTNLSTLSALSIGGVSAIPISNDGTTLVAMVMPGTATGTIAITTAGGNATSSSSFTIVASTPPTAQQGNKLVGTGNVGAAFQGSSVSVSADGNTAIVGGWGDNNSQGAAWVYIRSGGTWTQQGSKLVGTGAVGGAKQGVSVSLSADGNTAIVGGFADNSDQGAVWIFTRSGSTWTQQGNKLVGTGNIGIAHQGASVSLSADGNTAMVGGWRDNSYQGAAWVFTRSGGTWTQQGSKLVGTGAVGNARQGSSVSLSADGNTAMVGGSGDNTDQGAVWIFTRSGGTWTQQGNKLVGTGGVGFARHGNSVSLSADGNTAIVGGYGDNSQQGAAWVYTRSGGTWTQQGNKLVGTGNVGAAHQGFSVSVSADGNTAIVGGWEDSNGIPGASWVYTRSGGTWTQQGNKLVGTGAGLQARQGYSVSLSADGNTAMVGGYLDNGGFPGAAWVFIPCSPPIISTQPTNQSACASSTKRFAIVATNATSYQWEENAGSGFSAITNGGIYSGATTDTLTLTGLTAGMNNYQYRCVATSCASTTSNHATLSIVAAPIAPTISANNYSPCGGIQVTLTCPTPNVQEYLWLKNGTPLYYQNGGAGTYTINSGTVAASNDYTLQVVYVGSTCISAASTTATIVTNVPDAIITPTGATTFCAGSPTTLNANIGAGLTYQWKRGSTIVQVGGTSYIPTTSGSHTVTVTNSAGCTKTSAATLITVKALPTANAGADKSLCKGTSVQIGAASVTGNTYTWSPTTGLSNPYISNPMLTTNASGTYTVSVSNGTTGCSKSDAMVVTSISGPSTPTVSKTVNGSTITLSSVTPGAASVNWYSNGALLFSNMAANSSINVVASNPAKAYTIKSKGSNGCLSNFSNFVSAKIGDGKTGDVLVAIDENIMQAYPNPTNGLLNVVINDAALTSGTLLVYNNVGQVVATKEITFFAGKANITLNLQHLAAGVYTLSFENKVIKVVKE